MSIAPLQVVRQLSADELRVAKVFDWRPIMQKVAGLEFGEGVEVALSPGCDLSALRTAASRVARELGFRCSVRKTVTGVFLVKRELLEQRVARNAERNRIIAERRDRGETLEAIAVDFGLTRERVRQIHGKFDKFSKLPPTQRKAAVEDFLAPYRAKPAGRLCLCCRKPLGDRGHGPTCKECRTFSGLIHNLKNLLHYKNDHSRKQVVWMIRHFQIQPEDLDKA